MLTERLFNTVYYKEEELITMKRRFLAILAILVGSVSIVTYAQSRQETYDCADIPEVVIIEPKK